MYQYLKKNIDIKISMLEIEDVCLPWQFTTYFYFKE